MLKMLSLIKVISTGFMCIAIAWELGHFYDLPISQTIPNYFNYIFLFARFALIIHFIEGIAAAYYAATQNKNPLKYGIYTFFVGTVGLFELKKYKINDVD